MIGKIFVDCGRRGCRRQLNSKRPTIRERDTISHQRLIIRILKSNEVIELRFKIIVNLLGFFLSAKYIRKCNFPFVNVLCDLIVLNELHTFSCPKIVVY